MTTSGVAATGAPCRLGRHGLKAIFRRAVKRCKTFVSRTLEMTSQGLWQFETIRFEKSFVPQQSHLTHTGMAMRSLPLRYFGIVFMTLVMGASAATADLRVHFDEGAPKDRFRFENTGECALSNAAIRLDLSTSTAGLIFDVTGQGAGVDVFQPFEITKGETSLQSIPTVVDGQSEVLLSVSSLAPGAEIAFTIDVDDTIGQREITVSRSEIEGATVSFANGATSARGQFTNSAKAVVPITGC